MRLRLVLVLTLFGLLVVPGLSQATPLVPERVPHDACQPDPVDPNPQLLRCRYGPITVTPGSNLILFGPVSIESPRAAGYITRAAPNMIDAVTGAVPPIHHVHLHHGVWLNPARDGATPFMASGEEKTVSELPPGYGYLVQPTDQWVLNYMVHNQTAQTHKVLITYDLTFVPLSTGRAQGMKDVRPIWLDVVGGAYPVYDPVRPTDPAALPIHERKVNFSLNRDYEIVWMAGHVHPGGLRDEVRLERCGPSSPVAPAKTLFVSEAVPNERDGAVPPQSFGSWDYRMTATPPDWRFVAPAGTVLSVTAVYDTGHPWYEAMGIVVGWGHPLTAAEKAAATPCADPSSTGGQVTGTPADAPDFGGLDDAFPAPPPAEAGPPVTAVNIAGFDYSPGGLGQPSAPVAAGSTVSFRNFDAAASIFHTVTACEAPCNKVYGQSYPLPLWGFDSGLLGYGPPGVTAAENRGNYNLAVPETSPGTQITYYCRVHPSMRGSLQVVNP